MYRALAAKSVAQRLTTHSTGARNSVAFIRQLEGLVRCFRARSIRALGVAKLEHT
jgi:hypothetical protein